MNTFYRLARFSVAKEKKYFRFALLYKFIEVKKHSAKWALTHPMTSHYRQKYMQFSLSLPQLCMRLPGKSGPGGGRIVTNTNCLMAFRQKREAVKAPLPFSLVFENMSVDQTG